MSEGDGDWFRVLRPVTEAPEEVAAHEPVEVRAASGPVPDLVAALAEAANAAPSEPADIAAATDRTAEPALAAAEPAEAAAEPALAAAEPAEAAAEPALAAAEPAEVAAEPAPPVSDPDPRTRLRALTGGLADLSDAMAAIGVESVAVRTPGPARPAAPQPAAAADFRVRCPDCGPQFVAIADLRFVETGDGAEANRYLFTCPACGARVRRPAGPELAEILKSSGVATLALRRGPGQAL